MNLIKARDPRFRVYPCGVLASGYGCVYLGARVALSVLAYNVLFCLDGKPGWVLTDKNAVCRTAVHAASNKTRVIPMDYPGATFGKPREARPVYFDLYRIKTDFIEHIYFPDDYRGYSIAKTRQFDMWLLSRKERISPNEPGMHCVIQSYTTA